MPILALLTRGDLVEVGSRFETEDYKTFCRLVTAFSSEYRGLFVYHDVPRKGHDAPERLSLHLEEPMEGTSIETPIARNTRVVERKLEFEMRKNNFRLSNVMVLHYLDTDMLRQKGRTNRIIDDKPLWAQLEAHYGDEDPAFGEYIAWATQMNNLLRMEVLNKGMLYASDEEGVSDALQKARAEGAAQF